MIWLTWRQFRVQALTALGLLAAAMACFVITGLRMHHTYAADLGSCTRLNDCSDVLNQFSKSYDTAFNFTQLLVIAAPALIGIFWGAPLIGRELETGTHQLAWNQSVTRTRWLAVKLAGVGIASIATAAVLSYLLTWWAGPLDHVNGNRFAVMTFATRDIVPLAYAAFAFALGTTAGLLLRRTVPAMAVTLAVFIGVQILVPSLIRPNLLPSTTVNFPINKTTASRSGGIYTTGGGAAIFIAGLPIPQGAWVTFAPPVEDSSGQVVAASSHSGCFGFAGSPGPTKAGVPDLEKIAACLASYDLHQSVTYKPGRYYWPLQWYETGIFLALAGGLSCTSFWWIRRRRN
jgi:ABC-type transport system involved in multi-copper enzyme maturation permease subunit